MSAAIDHRARVEALRAEWRESLEAIADEQRAWRVLDEAVALSDARVDAAGARVELDVIRAADPLRDAGDVATGPGAERLFVPVDPLARFDAEMHVVRVLAKLFPGELKRACRERLTALYADVEPGLPADAREARIAVLRRKVLAIEIQEEAAIVAAERAGVVIGRRADVTATVVLGNDLTAPAATATYATIVESARQRHVVAADLIDRRAEARTHVTRLRDALERATATARAMHQDVPATFVNELDAAEAELTRVDTACARATDDWHASAACIPVLRDALRQAGQLAA